jgi:spermidine/putrescine-binding protein
MRRPRHTLGLLSAGLAATMLAAACSSPAAETGGGSSASSAAASATSAASSAASSAADPSSASSSGAGSSAGSSSAAATSEAALEDTLVIASWGGRFTETTKEFLADPFSQETGIDVQIVDVPGTQAAQLQAQKDAGNVQWDVLDSLGAADAFFMDQEGLLAPLTPEQTTAYSEALGEDKLSDFGFTYANLGYVIICNNATVTACPATVPEFFDTAKFPGRRELPGQSYSQMTPILAQAAGNPVDAALPIDIPKMLEPLQAIKPDVSLWYTSGDQQEQGIRQGEADMGIIYSGRAYNVRNTGTDVTINWAGAYDPGYTAIATDAPHPAAAAAFMDWVVEHPEAQAKWAEQMQYSVPSPKALELMPADIAQTLADYPANFEKLGQQDFDWYLQNKDAIDTGMSQIIQGS